MYKLTEKTTKTLGTKEITYTVTLTKHYDIPVQHPNMPNINNYEYDTIIHEYTSKKSMEDAKKAFANVVGTMTRALTTEVGPGFNPELIEDFNDGEGDDTIEPTPDHCHNDCPKCEAQDCDERTQAELPF